VVIDLLERYKLGCEFPRPLDEPKVEEALRTHYQALGLPRPVVKKILTPRAAGDAFAARVAWEDAFAAGDARDAGAAWAAWEDAFAARVAWDARDARAARAAGAAWAARDARAAGAAFAAAGWAGWAAWAARDASWVSHIVVGAGELGATTVLAQFLPILEALEAGCWLYWLGDTECLWMPQPQIWADSQHRCHRDDGPAFQIEGGETLWFWHGVLVNERIIEYPETITVEQVLAERNGEVARVMVARMGEERFVAESQAKVLDQDRDRWGQQRQLLEIPMPQHPRGNIRVVRYQTAPTDLSPERVYTKPVPWTVTTCAEAVAQRFGLTVKTYNPEIER